MLVDDPTFAPPLVPTGSAMAMPTYAAPFIWGRGGGRMTPDQVAQQEKEAQQLELAGMDASPVQSWTQGLARVAQELVGGREAYQARKAADLNTQESNSVAQALMADGAKPDSATIASALVDPYLDPTTREIAGKVLERTIPAPQQAHFFEANNGDQGAIDPVTGQVKILYHDPTPKVTYTAVDNPDGTKTLVPVVNGQVMWSGGVPQSSQPPATLPPDFFDNGGQAAPPPATFP